MRSPLPTFLFALPALAATLVLCSRGEEESRTLYPYSRLQEVPFTAVAVHDSFWLPRILTVQRVTIPLLLDIAEEEGKLDNFRIIAGKKEGRIRLHNAPDSDVYKLIEAAAYSLSTRYDTSLVERIEGIIADIADAQQPDGYLNTQYTLPDDHPSSPDLDTLHAKRFGYGEKDRWRSTLERWPYAYSQLYCAGHLMEAAAAWYRATGSDRLLTAALGLAGHIGKEFPTERIRTYADHPQVEIGLLKLYEITGDTSLLHLSDAFCRYVQFGRPKDIMLPENSRPLHEQRQAFSHCVRTGYIYTAATGVVRATGAADLHRAMTSIWRNLTGAKMYIHGGVGNGTPFEQHGFDYDLPIRDTYSESCAQIAQGQWNHQLNLLEGDGRYADVMEWEAYNGALSGIGLDGTKFLYANKLNMDTVGRVDYHSGVRTTYLFCCPSKLPGFVAGIGRWIYAVGNDHLVVNLFVESTVKARVAGKEVHLEQQTSYPWEGEVTLVFRNDPARKTGLMIRIPSWNASGGPFPGSPYFYRENEDVGYTLSVNGRLLRPGKTENGYITLNRRFRAGDRVTLSLDMPVRRICTDTRVEANRGRVALARGPVLYALEGADNPFDVLHMVLPPGSKVTPERRAGVPGGMTVLRGTGLLEGGPVDFTAIPYFSWQNRGIHPCCTLLTEDPGRVQQEERSAKEFNTDG